MIRRLATFALVACAFLVQLPTGGAQVAVDRTTPNSAASDLPERAGAIGYADVDSLRALPWFAEVVRHQLLDMGVLPRNAHQALTMLGHTHAAHASLVRGAGDTGLFATVVIHGDYTRNEVPTAIQGILPALLAALWQSSTIDGLRAYDMGVVVLLELTPNDWMLARRLRGALPIPGSTPTETLQTLMAEGQRMGVGASGRSLAYGVLEGPETVLPGQHPPTTLEDIFHGPSRALASFVAEGDVLVVNWDITLRHLPDAIAWEAHYRDVVGTLASRLHVPEATLRWTMSRADQRLVSRIELDHVAADAFVADVVGRALPPATTSATPPANAVGVGSP